MVVSGLVVWRWRGDESRRHQTDSIRATHRKKERTGRRRREEEKGGRRRGKDDGELGRRGKRIEKTNPVSSWAHLRGSGGPFVLCMRPTDHGLLRHVCLSWKLVTVYQLVRHASQWSHNACKLVSSDTGTDSCRDECTNGYHHDRHRGWTTEARKATESGSCAGDRMLP